VTDTTSLSFPRDPDSVPAARAALARFHGKLPAATLYDASLCLSELVTNAVQHPAAEAGDEIELELSLSEDALRIKVIDPGGDFKPGTPTEGDERGWGLFIVDQLSTRWGTQPGERTVMWFEMARGQAVPSESAEGGRSEFGEPEDPRRDEIANVMGRLRVKPVIQ
jgi:anti-sigma regulatory factor (Ser/Thr protein kinase)